MASDDESMEPGDRPDWVVYRCRHGCVHVQLGQVVLKFTSEEFQGFAALMTDASARYREAEAAPVARTH